MCKASVNVSKSFLYPILVFDTIDIYHVRKSILASLQNHLSELEGVVLDVGCGEMPYKALLLSSRSKVDKYIGLDLADNKIYNNSPDMVWDGETIPLPLESVDWVIATEVFEHCPQPDSVMREIYRVLKPAGGLFFTVPFLWPLHDVPYDQYRFTPFSLERLLKNSGFTQIDIKPHGGWDASLAQMIGLWVNRRPLPLLVKRLLQTILLPLVKILVRYDTVPTNYSGVMVTGFSGVARKH